MKVPLVDRRKSIRVKGEFLLELNNGKKVQVGKTVDLSPCGMCCETQRSLPLFDEMEIRFQLPGGVKGEKLWVRCKGVVVRCESGHGKGKYRVAFYFTECDPQSRQKITAYVKKGLLLAAAA